MTYDDIYTIISKYDNRLLVYFADRFNRLPVGEFAFICYDSLIAKSVFYKSINPEISDKLINAAECIKENNQSNGFNHTI